MLSDYLISPTAAKINTYCNNMVQSIIPLLNQIDMSHYQSFLNMMYHYTLDSGNRLHHASFQARDPEIKSVFADLAREEQYHYRLAQADLATFNKIPSTDTPKIVINFHQFWMDITPDEEYLYVGALFVLEHVAQFIKPHLMPHFARLEIGPERAKFILTHLVADEDHGERIMELCDDADSKKEHLLYLGAEKASNFWIDMHRQVLS